MATNKRQIADAVLFKVQGGYVDVASPVQYPDVYKAIEQKMNADFKMQHFSQTLASGDCIPEHAMIATYEDVAVTPYLDGLKSIATLPVMPISLPRNMGVFEIYDPKYPQNLFIPLLPQQEILLRSQPLINDVLGQVSYTPYRNKVIFNTNLPLLNNAATSTVEMRLLVMDISTYGEGDALPIPPDYEAGLIEYLVKIFMPMVQGDKDLDVYTEPQQPVKK